MHVCIYIYVTESLCCTEEIKYNIVNQLYFNLRKKKKSPGERGQQQALGRGLDSHFFVVLLQGRQVFQSIYLVQGWAVTKQHGRLPNQNLLQWLQAEQQLCMVM